MTFFLFSWNVHFFKSLIHYKYNYNNYNCYLYDLFVSVTFLVFKVVTI